MEHLSAGHRQHHRQEQHNTPHTITGAGENNQSSSEPSFQNAPPLPTMLVPKEFICPILGTIMVCPTHSANTGLHYDSSAIASWIVINGDVCPVTGAGLGKLTPNLDLLMHIIIWLQQQAEKHRKQHKINLLNDYDLLQAHENSMRANKRRRVDNDVMAVYDRLAASSIRTHTASRIEQTAKDDEQNRRKRRKKHQSIFTSGPSLFLPIHRNA